MKRLYLSGKRALLAAGAFLLAAVPALAHEKWYVDPGEYRGAIPDIFRIPTAAGIAIILLAVALLVIAAFIDRRHDGSKTARWIDAQLLRYRLKPRTLLGVLIGVSLMGAGLQQTLFSPSLHLPFTPYGFVLGAVSIALGTLFLFLEPLQPELGIGLALLFLAGLPTVPFWDLMEELLILGAAVFLITGESDRAPWKRWNTPERQRLGYQAFRVLTGLNFLVLASVKWLRPDLGIKLVEQYHLNFLAGAGLDAAMFVFLAAVVETLVAVCLLFRVAFRPAVIVAFFFFTVSIFALGFEELLGHLPIKAALFLFFIYGHWHKGERKIVE